MSSTGQMRSEQHAIIVPSCAERFGITGAR